jgi:hypothetical protein
MDINTDISGIADWIVGDKSPQAYMLKSQASAASIGGNFLQGMQLAQQQEKMERELPFKMKAMELDQKKSEIDMEGALIKRELDLEVRNGYKEIGKVISTVGSYEDGWLNPKYRSDFWSVVGRYPQLAKDPSFKSMTDNFDIAEKARGRMEEERMKIQGRSSLEGQKYGHRMDLAKFNNEAKLDQIGAIYDNKGKLQEDQQEFIGGEKQKDRDASKELNEQRLKFQYDKLDLEVRAKENDYDYREFMGGVSAIAKDSFLDTEEKLDRMKKLRKEVEAGRKVDFEKMFNQQKPEPSTTTPATPETPEQPSPSPYKSSDDVKAAFKGGKIKREEAEKILKEQFGFN